MTSARKAQSNRLNARASTGPRTAAGKRRSSRNAVRHGLTLPVLAYPSLGEDVEILAREIAGDGAGARRLELARRVAEAQIDVRRTRLAQRGMIGRAMADPMYGRAAAMNHNYKVAKKLAKVIGPWTPIPPDMRKLFVSPPTGPRKHAAILSDMAKQLAGMDRYESRALARRRRAVREFEAARRIAAAAAVRAKRDQTKKGANLEERSHRRGASLREATNA